MSDRYADFRFQLALLGQNTINKQLNTIHLFAPIPVNITFLTALSLGYRAETIVVNRLQSFVSTYNIQTIHIRYCGCYKTHELRLFVC